MRSGPASRVSTAARNGPPRLRPRRQTCLPDQSAKLTKGKSQPSSRRELVCHEGDEEKARAAGCDHFVTKPLPRRRSARPRQQKFLLQHRRCPPCARTDRGDALPPCSRERPLAGTIAVDYGAMLVTTHLLDGGLRSGARKCRERSKVGSAAPSPSRRRTGRPNRRHR